MLTEANVTENQEMAQNDCLEKYVNVYIQFVTDMRFHKYIQRRLDMYNTGRTPGPGCHVLQ